MSTASVQRALASCQSATYLSIKTQKIPTRASSFPPAAQLAGLFTKNGKWPKRASEDKLIPASGNFSRLPSCSHPFGVRVGVVVVSLCSSSSSSFCSAGPLLVTPPPGSAACLLQLRLRDKGRSRRANFDARGG